MAARLRGLLDRILARRREAAHDGVSDAELLLRFTRDRDEAAFELLVWRHGAMVLGLCRRAVRDEQLAEDAFQAVFLVLARKAGSVRGNLGGWLFRVARRVALRALMKQPVVQSVVETPAEPAHCPVERDELSALLDDEIARLPERLRRPVVLCYLGDRSTEDAARELGCPRGTVLSRLATARKRLAERLTRRGVTLPTALATTALSARLVSSATAAAAAYRTGAFVLSPATQLANGVIQTMSRATLLTVTGSVVLAAAMASGIGWVAASGQPGAGDQPGTGSAQPAAPVVPRAAGANAPPTKEADLAKLQKQSKELADQIAKLQDRIDAAALDNLPAIGLATLLAELQTLDTQIFQAEGQIKTEQAYLDLALKQQAEVGPNVLGESYIMDFVKRLPAVKEADKHIQKANEILNNLQRILPADHPSLKAAEKEVANATAQREAAQKAGRKEAEAAALDNRKKYVEERVNNGKIGVQSAREKLESLQSKRRALVERIATQKQREAKWEQLQDELRVLRQIQLDLFRQKTLAELGVELLPAAREDPRTEAQIKELRREIEALRKELQDVKDKKK